MDLTVSETEHFGNKKSIKTTHVIPTPAQMNLPMQYTTLLKETSNSNESLPDSVATHRLTSPTLQNKIERPKNYILIRKNADESKINESSE